MSNLSIGELLFFSGISFVILGACILAVSTFIFRHTGKKLNKILDETYGEL